MDKGKGKQVALDGFLVNGGKAYLQDLNEAQRESVTWKSTGGLQILAGPGSGKTRVLTCRVAYLVKDCGIKPEDLIVVTFTNKAATEMKNRLKGLLGEALASKLNMGTFHSVAVKFLRKYGKHVDLPNNFSIADQSDCQSILKPIIADHNKQMAAERNAGEGSSNGADGDIKVKDAQSTISKAKAKGIGPEKYLAEAEAEHNLWKTAIGGIYADYEAALRASNTLDFDDLLVYCERLFQVHPNAVKYVQHVLVDEFQDTNAIQYDIVKLMARASGSLTIVGDPDQSIYSWRSAEIENLHFMLSDFKGTHQVWLEENYRSTSSILDAALAVVQQDSERIQKSLRTSHPVGPPVVLRRFMTAQDEAAYIAYEIKRTIAYSGNQLNFDDFAILLRYNALSRAIEAALQSAGIASRMIGGHKFFDRAEVKDILAYLQLAENPSYNPAFVRVINTPKRGFGDKSIQDVREAAKAKKISCFEVVSRAVKGSSIGNIKPGQKTTLKPFVATITKVREMAAKGETVAAMIDYIVDKIAYKDYLEKQHGPDHTSRVENIHELKNYSDQVARQNAVNPPPETLQAPVMRRSVSNGDGNSASTPFELDEDSDDDDEKATPVEAEAIDLAEENALRTFLAASTLSTDAETQDAKEDKKVPKVTISTCHAAKGLEWPVVFLPASETGVYPAFQKSDAAEVAEERRLFYVAMTRGQAMLHMTHVARRMERGQTADKSMTEFLQPLAKDKKIALAESLEPLTVEMRACISLVTQKLAVKEDTVQTIINAFNASVPTPTYETEESRFKSDLPSGHPHLSYSQPIRAGQQWRMNAYAGDQAKRFAANLPNRGVNRFAGAFSMTPAAAGFTSASTVARSGSQGADILPPGSGLGMPAIPGFSSARCAMPANAGFSSARGAFSTAQSGIQGGLSGNYTGSVNRPFKAPSMAKPTNGAAHHIATIETRLTQQRAGVILNPVAPNSPHSGPGYSLPSDKDDSFAYLKGLMKDENDDIAPPRPTAVKKRASNGSSNPNGKRSKQ